MNIMKRLKELVSHKEEAIVDTPSKYAEMAKSISNIEKTLDSIELLLKMSEDVPVENRTIVELPKAKSSIKPRKRIVIVKRK